MSIYVQRVKDPVANADSAVDIPFKCCTILAMDMFIICLQYFCYGYTAITLTGTLLIFSLAYWAERANKKHLVSLYKEDKES